MRVCSVFGSLGQWEFEETSFAYKKKLQVACLSPGKNACVSMERNQLTEKRERELIYSFACTEGC